MACNATPADVACLPTALSSVTSDRSGVGVRLVCCVESAGLIGGAGHTLLSTVHLHNSNQFEVVVRWRGHGTFKTEADGEKMLDVRGRWTSVFVLAALVVSAVVMGGFAAATARTSGPCATSGVDGPAARQAFTELCGGQPKDCDPYDGRIYCFSRTVAAKGLATMAGYDKTPTPTTARPVVVITTSTTAGTQATTSTTAPPSSTTVQPSTTAVHPSSTMLVSSTSTTPSTSSSTTAKPVMTSPPSSPTTVTKPSSTTTAKPASPKTVTRMPATSKSRHATPEAKADLAKFDPAFPQMAKWAEAGARGGIPEISSLPVRAVVAGGSSADINRAIDATARVGGGAVLLKNGTYRIDASVSLRSNVSLVGESRDGVQAVIHMDAGNAFSLYKVSNAGIYRMTIRGSWGAPKHDWNVGDHRANNELPGNQNVAVKIKNSPDTWIDQVNIYDTGDFPLRVGSDHVTMRDLDVDGVHNKHGGAHGYLFILGGHNLLTQSKVTHLRHLSIQGPEAEYNVIYDNDFAQEISFHAGDSGNNLLEANRVTLPADMPNGTNGPDYRAVMGSWSTLHTGSKRPNFLWNNTLVEHNHGGDTWGSGTGTVWSGPIFDTSKGDQRRNFPAMNIRPLHNTLYAVRR